MQTIQERLEFVALENCIPAIPNLRTGSEGASTLCAEVCFADDGHDGSHDDESEDANDQHRSALNLRRGASRGTTGQ